MQELKLNDIDFSVIRDFVYRESSIVLDDGKRYLVQSRLRSVLKSYGLIDLGELAGRLHRTSEVSLRRSVVAAITTNETSFFRDQKPFDAMRLGVLPDLLERRGATRRLVIWSGAASNGQEPYSVAILLREYFPMLRNWEVRIVASDISCEALEKAERGEYSDLEVSRGLPRTIRDKYFTRVERGWRIDEDIRQSVEFREMNLNGVWTVPGQVDLALVRNVLIYFDMNTKRKILARIRDSLSPEGYLLLGGAETLLDLDAGFRRVNFEGVNFYGVSPAARAAINA